MTPGAVLGVVAALVACDLAPAESAPASGDVPVDLFKVANAGGWTAVRNSSAGLDAYARLDATGDAALVTWQGNAQLWCGAATWPQNGCAGGRYLDLVVQPQALPGAGDLGGKIPIVLVVNGVAQRATKAPNFNPDSFLGGHVTAKPSPLYGYQVLIDYRDDKAVYRQLRRCRTIEIRLLRRSFRFACGHLPADI